VRSVQPKSVFVCNILTALALGGCGSSEQAAGGGTPLPRGGTAGCGASCASAGEGPAGAAGDAGGESGGGGVNTQADGGAAQDSGGNAGGGAGGAGGEGQTGTDCTPTTCAAEEANCGTIPDGCGGELDCGTCVSGECGVTTPNVCGCPPGDAVQLSMERLARRATSSGFSGTMAEYTELYDVECTTVADCSDACVARGGSVQMCEASECLEGAGGVTDCLPAPVWSNLESIRFEATDPTDAIQLVVVDTPYDDVSSVLSGCCSRSRARASRGSQSTVGAT